MIKRIKEFFVSPIREALRFGSCKNCGIAFPCEPCNNALNKAEVKACKEFRKVNDER